MFDNKEFYLHKNEKTFDEAIEFCTDEGGKLFEGRSETVTETVTSYMEIAGVEGFWLGIHDRDNEGVFVYASDDLPIQWNNWKDGQPNNAGQGQDCVVLKNDPDWNGEWDDAKCDNVRSFPFVCFREKQSEYL